jgi:hypothetical protein
MKKHLQGQLMYVADRKRSNALATWDVGWWFGYSLPAEPES